MIKGAKYYTMAADKTMHLHVHLKKYSINEKEELLFATFDSY